MGGQERLPNGNTLICESLMGRFLEVTMDGEVVWEFVNPFYNDFRFHGENKRSVQSPSLQSGLSWFARKGA